jgi:hypothetical protein
MSGLTSGKFGDDVDSMFIHVDNVSIPKCADERDEGEYMG